MAPGAFMQSRYDDFLLVLSDHVNAGAPQILCECRRRLVDSAHCRGLPRRFAMSVVAAIFPYDSIY